MTARSSSGALIAGLILLALGVIFFVQNFYPSFSAWRMIARYWPVLPIIIGLRSIYGYFTWPETSPVPEKAPPKE